jgi:hypothetical protein
MKVYVPSDILVEGDRSPWFFECLFCLVNCDNVFRYNYTCRKIKACLFEKELNYYICVMTTTDQHMITVIVPMLTWQPVILWRLGQWSRGWFWQDCENYYDDWSWRLYYILFRSPALYLCWGTRKSLLLVKYMYVVLTWLAHKILWSIFLGRVGIVLAKRKALRVKCNRFFSF